MTIVRYSEKTDTLVYSETEAEPPSRATAVALGFFDGVHIGHAALLRATAHAAQERGLLPAVFSFQNLPTKGVSLLLSNEERLRMLLKNGIQKVFFADFEALRALPPEAFVRDILQNVCHAEVALSGENFRFGKNAQGTPALLQSMMEAHMIPPVLDGGIPVSATRVRHALASGEPNTAARLLGRPYTVSGCVTRGKMLGRNLGFPTANLPLHARLSFLSKGVYVTRAALADGRSFYAVTNIGTRPTVECGTEANAESHILNFSGDLYGQHITLSLLHYLRPERRFPSVSALTEQLNQDKKDALLWINRFMSN